MVQKFRVRYRRARVTVEGTRPNKCAACPVREDGLGRVELHHWKYAYSTAEVRKNPQLALENTIPLCYLCHRVADHIKNIMKDSERFHQVMTALSYAAIDRKKKELGVI